MTRRNLSVSLAVALLFLTAGARADETLKFRAIMHATSAQSQDIGDVDGHAATVARFSGLATFPDEVITHPSAAV